MEKIKVVHVPTELHQEAKVVAAKKGITLKEYVAEVLKKAVQKAS